MFPGSQATVYYNDAGEPLGWDYLAVDERPDPDDFYDRWAYNNDDDEEE